MNVKPEKQECTQTSTINLATELMIIHACKERNETRTKFLENF